MGNRAPKSEPVDLSRSDHGKCIYMQGLNTYKQCGKDGYPLGIEKAVLSVVGGMHHTLAILSTGEFVS